MAYTLGIVLFALGILFAVCVHEAGHMGTAKAFGMKVSRYFVGFGPTLWSFRRGETEYGVKALPLGGFVKIVGMTPQDDDVAPEDEPRAMWRFPAWKRTVVMSAGSITHFILAFVTLWVMFVLVGVPDYNKIDSSPAKVASVTKCVVVKWELDSSGLPRGCNAQDPKSPAAAAGLRPGDVITAVDGKSTPDYKAMRTQVRGLGDKDTTVTYTRGDQSRTVKVHIYAVDRVKDGVNPNKSFKDVTSADLERVGMLGVGAAPPRTTVGPLEGVTETGRDIGFLVSASVRSLGQIPQKIPNLIASLTGAPRDPNTPMSVIGASRIGGELVQDRDWTNLLNMFAVLNLFFGLFNMLPLLPMDGGHIAIAWFERSRSWLYARIGRADPGRVDYYKLTPLTVAVIGVLAVFVVLTGTADIINPVVVNR